MSSFGTASISSSLPLLDSPVSARSAPYPIVGMPADRQSDSFRFAQITTAVLWSGCVLVGVLGFVLPYSRPTIAAPAVEPVVVEKLVVELTNEALPPTTLPADPLAAPPPPSALAQLATVQPVAVAEPSTVAFALPVEGPTVTVATEQAAHSRPATISAPTTATGLPSPQKLVFGQGEGRQPAPEYPAHAAKQGQEGVVDIRLTVDANGRVIDTAVAAPCAWPLLNDTAERTVRRRWRFHAGSIRVYEVAIHFKLAK